MFCLQAPDPVDTWKKEALTEFTSLYYSFPHPSEAGLVTVEPSWKYNAWLEELGKGWGGGLGSQSRSRLELSTLQWARLSGMGPVRFFDSRGHGSWPLAAPGKPPELVKGLIIIPSIHQGCLAAPSPTSLIFTADRFPDYTVWRVDGNAIQPAGIVCCAAAGPDTLFTIFRHSNCVKYKERRLGWQNAVSRHLGFS